MASQLFNGECTIAYGINRSHSMATLESRSSTPSANNASVRQRPIYLSSLLHTIAPSPPFPSQGSIITLELVLGRALPDRQFGQSLSTKLGGHFHKLNGTKKALRKAKNRREQKLIRIKNISSAKKTLGKAHLPKTNPKKNTKKTTQKSSSKRKCSLLICPLKLDLWA